MNAWGHSSSWYSYPRKTCHICPAYQLVWEYNSLSSSPSQIQVESWPIATKEITISMIWEIALLPQNILSSSYN